MNPYIWFQHKVLQLNKNFRGDFLKILESNTIVLVLSFLLLGTTAFNIFLQGEISSELSGIYGLNFDRIFIVKGDIMTMANLDDKERIKRYTNENWKKLIEFLKNEIENKK